MRHLFRPESGACPAALAGFGPWLVGLLAFLATVGSQSACACPWAPGGPTSVAAAGTRAWPQPVQQTNDPDTAGPSGENVEPGGSSPDESSANEDAATLRPKGISLFSLLFRGGWFMLPLLVLSLLLVGISIERLISLRTDRIIPARMISQLGNLSRSPDGFDPRSAYRICMNHPSSASKIMQSMLLKVGRPLPEVEATIAESGRREVDRQGMLVSWLVLIAAVAPLVGLLGTVWGITQAFYDMTNLGPNENKADALATGIYTALVTTLVGLMIAIPSAVLAHVFENRIVKLFNRISELCHSLLPQVEKYEGQIRFTADADTEFAAAGPSAEPVLPTVPARASDRKKRQSTASESEGASERSSPTTATR